MKKSQTTSKASTKTTKLSPKKISGTSVSQVKTSVKSDATSKTTKTVKKPEIKKPLKAVKAIKTPEKKPVKKSQVKTAAVKSAATKKKTIKPPSIKKPLTGKISKVAAGKKEEKTETKLKVSAKTKITPPKTSGLAITKKPSARKIKKVPAETVVKTIKEVKATAKAESATKGIKPVIKILKTTPEKKPATGKALPKTKAKIKQKAALKPKEKTVQPARKIVKKKKASSSITKELLSAISEKTVAEYIAPLQEGIKPGQSAKLKIFLPEEELRSEEPQRIPSSQLPEEYGENELLLMEVDPSIVFVSWEIRPADISGETGKLTLRVYDVTGIDFDSSKANRSFDISLKNRVDSKFINIKMPGKDVIMEVGILRPNGAFKAIKRSNRVSMPALQTFEELGITGSLSDTEIFIGY